MVEELAEGGGPRLHRLLVGLVPELATLAVLAEAGLAEIVAELSLVVAIAVQLIAHFDSSVSEGALDNGGGYCFVEGALAGGCPVAALLREQLRTSVLYLATNSTVSWDCLRTVARVSVSSWRIGLISLS